MLQALPDMEIGRAARNPAAHRYQTARSFTSTLRTAGSPEHDAKQMLELLNSAIRSSNDPGEWLKAGPSPRTLPTRRKEPDYAWAPRGHTHTHTDGLPTVVLEVAVFNETEEDLLAEGSEWLDLPTTQIVILVKVIDEANPPEEMREVVDVYKDTRLQNARIAALHANTTHAAAPKASQGSISFEGCIADRVKRWRTILTRILLTWGYTYIADPADSLQQAIGQRRPQTDE
ncbi:hypothetical protein WJX82_005844 [Trebouxia sp. C0006]